MCRKTYEKIDLSNEILFALKTRCLNLFLTVNYLNNTK